METIMHDVSKIEIKDTQTMESVMNNFFTRKICIESSGGELYEINCFSDTKKNLQVKLEKTEEEKTILEQLKPDNISIQKQIELLSKFLIKEFGDNIGNKGKGEGVIEMAVRLLEQYKSSFQCKKETGNKN